MPRISKSEDVEVKQEEKFEIEYRDYIPIFIPKLYFYPEGVSIGKPGVRISVTEKEKRRLLKHMNGNNPKFVEV